MSSETLINTACNPTPLLPGSGLETKLQLHHNGVMTYSHYVNGSIFSVPKFEVVAKNNHNSTGFDVMGHPVKASDHLVETVYGLVKFFLGWDYYSMTLKLKILSAHKMCGCAWGWVLANSHTCVLCACSRKLKCASVRACGPKNCHNSHFDSISDKCSDQICHVCISSCTIAYEMHEEVFLFQNIIIEVKSCSFFCHSGKCRSFFC